MKTRNFKGGREGGSEEPTQRVYDLTKTLRRESVPWEIGAGLPKRRDICGRFVCTVAAYHLVGRDRVFCQLCHAHVAQVAPGRLQATAQRGKGLCCHPRRGSHPGAVYVPLHHARGDEVPGDGGKTQAWPGGHADPSPQSSHRDGQVPGAVVRLLPHHPVLHVPSVRTHG